jgi:uncharacterized protein (TIGR03382 family)
MNCGVSGIPADEGGGNPSQLAASIWVGRLNLNVPEPASPLLALLAVGLLALIRRR